ncbi:Chromosomal replication initiator protein DnaA, partial [Clarias magur]
FGAAIHDDAPPPDPCQPASCVSHHGNESDEPPQHHRQYGRRSTGTECPFQN